MAQGLHYWALRHLNNAIYSVSRGTCLHFKDYFEAALFRAIALSHGQQEKATAESSGQAGMWMLVLQASPVGGL
jgi:hypothetical protein